MFVALAFPFETFCFSGDLWAAVGLVKKGATAHSPAWVVVWMMVVVGVALSTFYRLHGPCGWTVAGL